jgi:predicted  nucleic acid-binding Zn-ribbon protein
MTKKQVETLIATIEWFLLCMTLAGAIVSFLTPPSPSLPYYNPDMMRITIACATLSLLAAHARKTVYELRMAEVFKKIEKQCEDSITVGYVADVGRDDAVKELEEDVASIKKMIARDNEQWSNTLGDMRREMKKELRGFTIKKFDRLASTIDTLAARTAKIETENVATNETVGDLSYQTGKVVAKASHLESWLLTTNGRIDTHANRIDELKSETSGKFEFLKNIAEGFRSQMNSVLDLITDVTESAQEALKRGTESRHGIEALTTRLIDAESRLRQEIENNRANMDAVTEAREVGIKSIVEADARTTWDRINTAHDRISSNHALFEAAKDELSKEIAAVRDMCSSLDGACHRGGSEIMATIDGFKDEVSATITKLNDDWAQTLQRYDQDMRACGKKSESVLSDRIDSVRSSVRNALENQLVSLKTRIESLEHETREANDVANATAVSTADKIRKLTVMIEATAQKSDSYHAGHKKDRDALNRKLDRMVKDDPMSGIRDVLHRSLDSISAKFGALALDIEHFGKDEEGDDLADSTVIPEDNGQ